MTLIRIVIIWVTVFVLGSNVCCDYYTSVVGMDSLILAESHLVQLWEKYLKETEETRQQVNDFLTIVEENHIEDDAIYDDPLSGFKIIKRLAVDWKAIEKILLEDSTLLLDDNMKANMFGVSQADLLGASKGMARLQSTYALQAAEIAQGLLIDRKYNANLSASDCFELGRYLYDARKYRYAKEWLLEANKRLDSELAEQNNTLGFPSVLHVQILEYLAPSMFYLGNYKMAVKLNEDLLDLDANHEHGLQNKELYEAKVIEERRTIETEKITTEEKRPTDDLYEKVCRGELQPTPDEQRDLRCRYVTNNVPFCLLAPFKMEELSLDPYVAVYYDSIYDSEMANIINVTQQKVVRSKVGDVDTSQYSDVRTSKNTWLNYKNHAFLNNIAQRLRDITGLSLETAEELQVANYGIGGEYAPHHDFFEETSKTFETIGNRIATALFFINDVELGGATVFPYLRLAVPPIKGSLVLWYNMHDSLDLDYRTRHAGCPVLKGSKWICNEWFHSLGQEFLKPCGLKPTGNRSLSFKNIY